MDDDAAAWEPGRKRRQLDRFSKRRLRVMDVLPLLACKHSRHGNSNSNSKQVPRGPGLFVCRKKYSCQMRSSSLLPSTRRGVAHGQLPMSVRKSPKRFLGAPNLRKVA